MCARFPRCALCYVPLPPSRYCPWLIACFYVWASITVLLKWLSFRAKHCLPQMLAPYFIYSPRNRSAMQDALSSILSIPPTFGWHLPDSQGKVRNCLHQMTESILPHWHPSWKQTSPLGRNAVVMTPLVSCHPLENFFTPPLSSPLPHLKLHLIDCIPTWLYHTKY